MPYTKPLADELPLLRRALRAAADRTGSETARRRIWAQIATPPRVGRRGLRWLLPVLAAAAGLVVMEGLRLYTLSIGTTPVPEQELARSPPALRPPEVDDEVAANLPREPLVEGPASIRTGGTEERSLRLWGGTEIDLGRRSRFLIDGRHRPWLADGEARLLVPSQHPSRPFVLSVGSYRLSSAGGRCKVAVSRNRIAVRVHDGVIDVSGRDSRRIVRLGAGDSWTSRPSARFQSDGDVAAHPRGKQ